jgi:SHS2 domain-containing protein
MANLIRTGPARTRRYMHATERLTVEGVLAEGEGMYETFEHTADLGLRVRAPDLNALFAEAAACLFSAIVEDPAAVRPLQRIDLRIEGADREYLLFDWLRELLYRFDSQHLLFGRFEVRVNEAGLEAAGWGEPFDPERHALAHEVKAVTYHGLKVERTADGWLAEVIVDI